MELSKLKSVADVPKEEIFDQSKDGKTIVTNDGTKVTADAIAAAKKSAKATE